MLITDILPTNLGVEICPFHDEVKTLILDEIDSHGNDYEYRKPKSNTLEHLDYYSPLHDDKFTKFREWIQEQAGIYARDILGYDVTDLVVTYSWINICKPGGHQVPHYHINSFVCALYYVNFDDEIDSPTYFWQPNPTQPRDFPVMLTRKNQTKYNSLNEIVGLEGTLLLWPSNLIHGYKTNYTENRITISTNIMPTTVGSYKITPLNKEERHIQMLAQRSGQLWDVPEFI